MNNDLLSNLLQVLLEAVITVVVPIIAAYVIKWLQQQAKKLQAEIPEQMLWTIRRIASLAVEAAEQKGLTDQLLAEGKAKKDYAMQVGEQWLKSQFGLHLDLNKLGDDFWAAIMAAYEAAVESEVYGLRQDGGKLESAR